MLPTTFLGEPETTIDEGGNQLRLTFGCFNRSKREIRLENLQDAFRAVPLVKWSYKSIWSLEMAENKWVTDGNCFFVLPLYISGVVSLLITVISLLITGFGAHLIGLFKTFTEDF